MHFCRRLHRHCHHHRRRHRHRRRHHHHHRHNHHPNLKMHFVRLLDSLLTIIIVTITAELSVIKYLTNG